MSSFNPKKVLGPILRQFRGKQGLSHLVVAQRYRQTGFECSAGRIIRIENQNEPIKDYEVLIFERIFGGSEITQFFT